MDTLHTFTGNPSGRITYASYDAQGRVTVRVTPFPHGTIELLDAIEAIYGRGLFPDTDMQIKDVGMDLVLGHWTGNHLLRFVTVIQHNLGVSPKYRKTELTTVPAAGLLSSSAFRYLIPLFHRFPYPPEGTEWERLVLEEPPPPTYVGDGILKTLFRDKAPALFEAHWK